jgi:ABC-type glycerol-3-phosphate transport system permease component
MFIGSLSDIYGVMRMPPQLWPKHPILDNYLKMLQWPLLKWLYNSLVVVIISTVLSILVSSSAGYIFAFYDFRFKNILWSLFLIGIMIPRISLLIPMFVIIRKLGLSGTLLAAILPIVFSPFNLYLARNYFESIPKSLLESARIDGARESIILVRIIMPISAPIVTSLGLFSAIGALQDFIWQMLVLQKDTVKTLLIGMIGEVSRRGGGDLNINPLGRGFAVSIILMLPLIIVFLVSNKYFINAMDGFDSK